MIDSSKPKVVIDTNIANAIPTVAVSQQAFNEDIPKDAQPATETAVPQSLIKRCTNFFLDFLETIVVALSIFVVVYLFLVQPHEVKGSSMEPNFHNNDYILTDKISLKLHSPSRGDVVIFKAPRNPEVDYIKRVIGLPGEKVKIQKGYVYVNDKKLDESYLADITNLFPGSFVQEGIDITVPEGEYFVMGDNRSHSSDSREFGPISSNLIIGKAFFRYWPPTGIGLMKGYGY